jgi:hypothetical protein
MKNCSFVPLRLVKNANRGRYPGIRRRVRAMRLHPRITDDGCSAPWGKPAMPVQHMLHLVPVKDMFREEGCRQKRQAWLIMMDSVLPSLLS